ncbi:MAG: hypothetical protein SWY16_24105 [Cyanobacteriota bacterium]|nr:hypothetical protein [Cyanobacteriota bacterium]
MQDTRILPCLLVFLFQRAVDSYGEWHKAIASEEWKTPSFSSLQIRGL